MLMTKQRGEAAAVLEMPVNTLGMAGVGGLQQRRAARYSLVGLDEDWVEGGLGRFATRDRLTICRLGRPSNHHQYKCSAETWPAVYGDSSGDTGVRGLGEREGMFQGSEFG